MGWAPTCFWSVRSERKERTKEERTKERYSLLFYVVLAVGCSFPRRDRWIYTEDTRSFASSSDKVELDGKEEEGNGDVGQGFKKGRGRISEESKKTFSERKNRGRKKYHGSLG